MTDIKVCVISDEVKETMRKFRFRKDKNNAAVIMKINLTDMIIEIDEEMADCSIEEVAAELPEFSPRYVAFSYCHTHGDGRVSYPMVFLHYAPSGVKPEHNMVYAGTKTALVNAIQITKVFEVRDAEEMTEKWLKDKLGFFS